MCFFIIKEKKNNFRNLNKGKEYLVLRRHLNTKLQVFDFRPAPSSKIRDDKTVEANKQFCKTERLRNSTNN